MYVSAPFCEMEKALSSLGEVIAMCSDDMDLLVAKACILHASAQFKSAEEVLDLVLSKVPDHNERLSSLHPVMAFHLRLDHRVQVVRDSMQKTLAIVTEVQGPPFDNRTQVKVEWVLSQTEVGPLVVYYT